MPDNQYNVSWPGWNIVRLIGQGSFGAVYEIERDVFGHTEKAALKVISIPRGQSDIEELYNDGYDTESITQRFESYLKDIVREYSLMAEMKGHTNIVYCDDLRYIQHDDGMGWDIYIKMELLTPLTKKLQKEKQFPEEEVLKIALDMCDALLLCKNSNIIHRDIKPQNIFISKNGNYKLGDFGIAKTAEHTTSGTKTGTYKYMAPEVYNNQPYGSAADIYSLGMVLYWLLNERRTPFLPLPPKVPTATEEDCARDERFAGKLIPSPLHGSPALKAIVLKACAYDPVDRYASAMEMKQDLEKINFVHSISSEKLIIKDDSEEHDNEVVDIDSSTIGGFGIKKALENNDDSATIGNFERVERNSQKLSSRKVNIRLFASGIITALVIIAVIIAKALGAPADDQQNATVDIVLETTVPSIPPSEDPYYQEVESYCASLQESGNYLAAVVYVEDCLAQDGPDMRLEALLQNCIEMYENDILQTAQAYTKENQYRYAIQFLIESQQQFESQRIYDATVQCMQDFGLFNTQYISAGKFNTMLIRDNGIVNIVGDSSNGELNANGWSNIVAVSAGDRHVIGLKSDGTVVAEGENIYDQCNVDHWNDVVAISAGDVHTVVLKEDGTVDSIGFNKQKQCNVEKLMSAAGEKKIASVAAGYHHTLALLEDGSVVACGSDSVYKECCDVYDWSDIVSIYAGTSYSAGLKVDGTVVITGRNKAGDNIKNIWNVSEWTDIINLAAGDYFLVGLRSDGSIVTAGLTNEDMMYDVSAWKNIVCVSAGNNHIVALTANGKILSAGGDAYGQCDFQGTTIQYPKNQR